MIEKIKKIMYKLKFDDSVEGFDFRNGIFYRKNILRSVDIYKFRGLSISVDNDYKNESYKMKIRNLNLKDEMAKNLYLLGERNADIILKEINQTLETNEYSSERIDMLQEKCENIIIGIEKETFEFIDEDLKEEYINLSNKNNEMDNESEMHL